MMTLEQGIAAFKEQDYAETLRVLKPIAETGNAEAQCIIGNLYHLGLGVIHDSSEATKWYQKASDQGYGLAANNLAGMALGEGDLAEAERLFCLARKQGFDHAPTSANYLRGE